jgi:hypothetical protein
MRLVVDRRRADAVRRSVMLDDNRATCGIVAVVLVGSDRRTASSNQPDKRGRGDRRGPDTTPLQHDQHPA